MTDASTGPDDDPSAGERYLLLADITGYTGFMAGVEIEHGADFSAGIPAAYGILGGLLDSVVMGIAPDFDLVKLEGDAVFAVAPAARLDGDGTRSSDHLGTMYQAFIDSRTRAIPSNDHVCIACPAVAHLDLKVILHRGHTVRQTVGASSDLLGPAVNLAHRLLKNTIRERIGSRPYLFVTDAAIAGLGLEGIGSPTTRTYADAGPVDGRVVELGGPAAGDRHGIAGLAGVRTGQDFRGMNRIGEPRRPYPHPSDRRVPKEITMHRVHGSSRPARGRGSTASRRRIRPTVGSWATYGRRLRQY